MNIRNIQQKSRAFTLIEILVVIAIMGILAGLITWGARRAAEARAKRKIEAELIRLQASIDDYHAKLGFYPPSNTNDAAIPPLFYELSGMKYNDGTQKYATLNGDRELHKSIIDSVFKLGGFANSNEENAKDFLGAIKPNQLGETNGVAVLVVGVPGPIGLNTWRYVSSESANPTNNPNSYDLWAEVVVGGQTNIIGNWKR